MVYCRYTNTRYTKILKIVKLWTVKLRRLLTAIALIIIGVPSMGAGGLPPHLFENLQTGPQCFLKNNTLLDGPL